MDLRLLRGARVRISVRVAASASVTDPRVGVIAGVGGDTLRVQFEDEASPEPLPLPTIAHLEESRGEPRLRRFVGGLAGLLVGGVLGLKFGQAIEPASCRNGCSDMNDAIDMFAVTIATTSVGSLAGMYIGKNVAGRERWVDMPVPRSIGLGTSGREVRLGWSLPFSPTTAGPRGADAFR